MADESKKDAHTRHVESFKGYHTVVQNSTEGGKCLVRLGKTRGSDGYLVASSCNHRWQGFQRALNEDRHRYNWPAYRSLSTATFEMMVRGASNRAVSVTTGPVPKDAWNVSVQSDNFRTACSTPYWHESHHLVTNGLLGFAIAEAAAAGADPAGTEKAHKAGLLKAGYNLNHKENMVILPLDVRVCAALDFPAHRENGRPNHRVYDAMVKKKLKEVFAGLKDAVQLHGDKEDAPNTDWSAVTKRLVNVSRHLRKWVFTRGGLVSLDRAASPAPGGTS